MIKNESFDYFGNIPVLEKEGITYVNLLGKHLLCEDCFYPSDESHVAFLGPQTNVAFIRNSDGLGFYFPPEEENIFYIVTPDIQKHSHRKDLVVPNIVSLYSENTYLASALQ